MNHIVNGDFVGEKLRKLSGNIVVWREMYDFGPLCFDWTYEESIRRRAEFFESKLEIPASFFIENCQQQSKRLSELSRSEEIVLWFEHDRYDQTMLLFLLTQLSTLGFQNISMITLNEYEGIEPFQGLGQLSFEQLVDLLHIKQKVTDDQLQEPIDGWKAYTSSDLTEITTFIEQCHALPFIKQALLTHLEYLPSDMNGLNEVEHLALSMLEDGTKTFAELFKKISQMRSNDGLSDLYFAALLNELMKGDYPLISNDQALPNYHGQSPKANLKITERGLDVLHGKANRIKLNGIDWWVGGIHLCEPK